MNIKRFLAANSRAALRQVRDALGGEAIILSNRATADGVEVLAASPADMERMQSATAPAPRVTASGPVPESRARRAAPAAAATVKPGSATPAWVSEAQSARTRRRLETLIDGTEAELGGDDQDELGLASDFYTEPAVPTANPQAQPRAVARPAAPAQALVAPASAMAHAPQRDLSAVPPPRRAEASDMLPDARPRTDATQVDMREELRSMRSFMEEQLSTMAWTESVRQQPQRMRLMQDLLMAGFSAELARHLQDHLPHDYDAKQAADWVQDVLRRNLHSGQAETDLVEEGGVFAIVGPTGVGKTTTTAKLAARFAVKHGASRIALITTDGYRIGAQDQLRIYGKILGIDVHAIHDQASLTSAVSHLTGKKLVLIDTAGISQRDERVAEQIAMLRGARARRLLVLNATSQAETLDEVVNAYADRDFAGCVISKIDEAVRLGPVLDVVVRHRLKIHYVANGQRVPEDLHYPNAQYLLHRALKPGTVTKPFALHAGDEPAWLGAIAQASRAASTPRRSQHV